MRVETPSTRFDMGLKVDQLDRKSKFLGDADSDTQWPSGEPQVCSLREGQQEHPAALQSPPPATSGRTETVQHPEIPAKGSRDVCFALSKPGCPRVFPNSYEVSIETRVSQDTGPPSRVHTRPEPAHRAEASSHPLPAAAQPPPAETWRQPPPLTLRVQNQTSALPTADRQALAEAQTQDRPDFTNTTPGPEPEPPRPTSAASALPCSEHLPRSFLVKATIYLGLGFLLIICATYRVSFLILIHR
ncbi:SH3 domain-binding protein 1-like [Myotis daubentonii]|uniref:SH3 domain-binding protein 1-like n=1 Tax=Myotis daubentonii TaxID=98922 RepID=UPI00287325AE|nr:SH3 domain-binding protein 1-like [Myotis daubentonii]